jgi:hypothetical protein
MIRNPIYNRWGKPNVYPQSFTLLTDTIMTECNCTVGSTGNALIGLLVMTLLNNLTLVHYMEF